MVRQKSTDEIVEKGPGVTILKRNLDLHEVDLTMASYDKFQKLAKEFDLTVRVYAVHVRVDQTFYAESGKRRGEVLKEAHERNNIFMTLTNMEDFAIDATWYGTEFQNMYLGGPRSHSNQKFGLTKGLKEARECLI